MHRLFTLALGTCVLASCRPQTQVGSPANPAGQATIRNAVGASLGDLSLTSTATGVRIQGTLTGLPPGTHGIHLHAVGRCDTGDFVTAGSHLNPSARKHGLENPEGPHAGDLPNITASSSGTAAVDLTDPRVTLDANASRGLFDSDGTAIVVHATTDDQKTDPSGNSGARIACGVIDRR